MCSQAYQNALNELNDAKYEAESFFLANLDLRKNHDIKSTWAKINQRLGKAKGNEIPLLVDSLGNSVYDPKGKADLLNSYFGSVFTPIDNHLANDRINPNGTTSAGSVGGFSLSVDDILRELIRCKSSTFSPDGVPSKLLKLAPDLFAPYLYLIFAKSFENGEIPLAWKESIIIPLHKKGSRTDPGNFRPINNTSHCCKIMERLICNYMHSYLEKEHILFSKQHGFRPKFSCETQVTALVQDISSEIDKGDVVDAVLLDFSAAFDKVNHQTLKERLLDLGFEAKIISWIMSFLTNRTQKVRERMYYQTLFMSLPASFRAVSSVQHSLIVL